MTMRLEYQKAAPEPFKAMYAVEMQLRKGLDAGLLHLVKLRASQMNGCAFCVDMHWKDAVAGGESTERLYMLNAWRESDLYTERERAALAWTEALTLVSETHAPDDVYEVVRSTFNDAELAYLTWAIAAINAWNRIGVGFRSQPGVYKPAKSR